MIAPANIKGWAPVGPFVVSTMTFPQAGSTCEYHDHEFDHITFIGGGDVVARAGPSKDEVETERVVKSGEYVLIRAGRFHQFEALSSGVWGHCVYRQDGLG